MPDIAMCINTDCPIRGSCYRYRAVPDQRQSYTSFTPVGETCDHYVELWYRDKLEPLDVCDARCKGIKSQG